MRKRNALIVAILAAIAAISLVIINQLAHYLSAYGSSALMDDLDFISTFAIIIAVLALTAYFRNSRILEIITIIILVYALIFFLFSVFYFEFRETLIFVLYISLELYFANRALRTKTNAMTNKSVLTTSPGNYEAQKRALGTIISFKDKTSNEVMDIENMIDDK